jgi:hypothetical protein
MLMVTDSSSKTRPALPRIHYLQRGDDGDNGTGTLEIGSRIDMITAVNFERGLLPPNSNSAPVQTTKEALLFAVNRRKPSRTMR